VQAKFVVVVLLVAAAAIAAGCSRNDARDGQGVGLLAHNPLAPGQESAAKPDSTPHPGPPPHPSKQGLLLQFTGSDSVAAGQTSITRWQFTNGGHQPLNVSWTLNEEANWSGFPKTGTLSLAGLSTQTISIPVGVPDSALAGFYPLHMAAAADHDGTANADGGIRVLGGVIPPDSLVAGRR
jgi:hypothetical protein